MGMEESLVFHVVKLASVISLKSFNGARKLGANIGIKACEEGMHFRFLSEWKCPSKMRKVIENN